VLSRRGATLEEMRYEDSKRVCFVPEAGKAEDLRRIGERAAERNVTLHFALAPRTPDTTTRGRSWPIVRELGGAAQAIRELITLSRREK
jgi:hypothetical protein